MSTSGASEAYSTFLTNEGYRPTLDSDGDVVFKREGRTYLILIDDADPTFFRLVFPNFWEIESDPERLQVLLAAQSATADTKVAKVFIVGDNVWASVEQFVSEPASATAVFDRALGAIDSAVSRFVATMRQQADEH